MPPSHTVTVLVHPRNPSGYSYLWSPNSAGHYDLRLRPNLTQISVRETTPLFAQLRQIQAPANEIQKPEGEELTPEALMDLLLKEDDLKEMIEQQGYSLEFRPFDRTAAIDLWIHNSVPIDEARGVNMAERRGLLEFLVPHHVDQQSRKAQYYSPLKPTVKKDPTPSPDPTLDAGVDQVMQPKHIDRS